MRLSDVYLVFQFLPAGSNGASKHQLVENFNLEIQHLVAV